MLKEKLVNSGKGIFYFILEETLTAVDDFKVKELIKKRREIDLFAEPVSK